MKNVFLTIGLAVSILVANAQTSNPLKAGMFSVGGNIGVQIGSSTSKAGSASVDGPSTFALVVLPNAQYFLSDKLSVGLQIGIGTKSTTNKAVGATPESSSSDVTFSASPYIRYYEFIGDGRFAFFGQGAVGITTQSGTEKSGTFSSDKPNTFTFGVGVSPGIIFFPTNRIGIEAVIGNVLAVQTSSTTTKAVAPATDDLVETKTTFDFLNVNTLAFQLGFNYYFGN